MSKRLIVVLAALLVAGLTCAAYAEVQNVKVSGDLTVYGLFRDLEMNKADGVVAPTQPHQSMITITRARIDADLTDNVMTTVRLINERYWGSQDEGAVGVAKNTTGIDVDLAMVTLKEFLYSPATLIVGRQELRYGNAMIVGSSRGGLDIVAESAIDADTDLSMRTSFDAIRLVLNYDPLVVDIVAAKVEENTTNVTDDQNLYGINATYTFNKDLVAEAYWFQRRIERQNGGNGQNKPGYTDTLGLRAQSTAIANATLMGEFAVQVGKSTLDTSFPEAVSTNNTAKRNAWAAELAAIYDWKNVKYTPSGMLGYAYFSGQNDEDDEVIKAWDPMFEDQKFGDIANAQFQQSNAHIITAAGWMRPTDDIVIKGEYFAFWWDKKYNDDQVIANARGTNNTMRHNGFAGSEVDLTATYAYTEDVTFSLLSGIFFPGPAFADATDNIATEVIGSMKVTF